MMPFSVWCLIRASSTGPSRGFSWRRKKNPVSISNNFFSPVGICPCTLPAPFALCCDFVSHNTRFGHTSSPCRFMWMEGVTSIRSAHGALKYGLEFESIRTVCNGCYKPHRALYEIRLNSVHSFTLNLKCKWLWFFFNWKYFPYYILNKMMLPFELISISYRLDNRDV